MGKIESHILLSTYTDYRDGIPRLNRRFSDSYKAMAALVTQCILPDKTLYLVDI